MIDASKFATTYNAFWNAYTPTCEHFVRRLNLSGLDRLHPPMPPSNTTERRALVAEFAFSLFTERKKGWRRQILIESSDLKNEFRNLAWSETVKRLAPYAAQGLDIERALNDEEEREVQTLANRLEVFFNSSKRITLRPIFAGCGYVDASEGDVIFDSTIFEVKTVERPVRSSDLRQTLTYAALNWASKQFDVQNVGLFNPRRGLYFSIGLEDVCFEISGRPAQELLALIVEAISSGDISR